MKRSSPGYTLIEVLVASAILMTAIAAATALALATVGQEETNQRVARCLNLHEQAVRLYQLGLEPSKVATLLPADPAVISLVFDAENLSIPQLGTVEKVETTLTFTTTPLSEVNPTHTWNSGESSDTARRTSTLIAIRPSIR